MQQTQQTLTPLLLPARLPRPADRSLTAWPRITTLRFTCQQRYFVTAVSTSLCAQPWPHSPSSTHTLYCARCSVKEPLTVALLPLPPPHPRFRSRKSRRGRAAGRSLCSMPRLAAARSQAIFARKTGMYVQCGVVSLGCPGHTADPRARATRPTSCTHSSN